MAIILDDRARAAIARRRACGREAVLYLRVEMIAARGYCPRILAVDWAARHRSRRPLVERRVGDVAVCMDRRVARYTYWRNVTISAWHLGPLDRLVVEDEPAVALEMEEWERTHRPLNPVPTLQSIEAS